AWHNRVGKPVIAAVNGVCAGGGLHFVADADIVIASPNATFLDPHVSVGQVSAFETIALARRSPMEAITRMALIGRYERSDAGRAGCHPARRRGDRPDCAPIPGRTRMTDRTAEPTRPRAPRGDLAGYEQYPYTADGVTHTVYRKGTGPVVVVITEMPGISP